MNVDALLEAWAAKYEVKTVLERAVGVDAEPACTSLARRGATIVTIADDEAVLHRARATYGVRCVETSLSSSDDGDAKSDLVVVHGEEPLEDWRTLLARFGKRATKLLVLVTPNPATYEARARSLLARVTGATHANGANGWGKTEALAPVLWEIGRVREHLFLDVPAVASRRAGLAASLAPLHAFVVDLTPRTPQARRRVRLTTTT